MSVILKKVIQTSWACPSQWDAWDTEGRYYYLRYRSGIGTVDTYPDPDPDTWEHPPNGAVARFKHGDALDGCIDLHDFLARAGIAISARVVWAPDDADPIEFNANVTIRLAPPPPTPPDTSPATSATGHSEELTFVRHENPEAALLPPQTRRFLVARWPDGLTKIREVAIPPEQAMDETHSEAGHGE